jgi:hypothetical protein
MLTRGAHASMQMTHTAGGVWLMGGAAAAAVEEEATLAEAVEPVEAVEAAAAAAAARALTRAATTTVGE